MQYLDILRLQLEAETHAMSTITLHSAAVTLTVCTLHSAAITLTVCTVLAVV
jgi:hypothetical protein